MQFFIITCKELLSSSGSGDIPLHGTNWQHLLHFASNLEKCLNYSFFPLQCPLIAVIVSEISLFRAAACYVAVQFLMRNCFYIFLIYISENVKASRVIFVLKSHIFYPFYPFSIGALLGGDLNNSNGGCPSPVRKYSHICSDHEFDDLLTYCFFFFFITKRFSGICIRVFIPNAVQGSSSPLLSSSAPSEIMPWRDQGMPPVTSTDIHGNPCTSPWTCSLFYVAPCDIMVHLFFSVLSLKCFCFSSDIYV